MLDMNWNSVALITGGQSRAINGENRRGEKGKGGMAASDLGPSRKGSPCLRGIQPGDTVELADIEGPGTIQHIWITVKDKTTDADCFVLRDLVLRFYWDGQTRPSVEVPLGDFFCCGFGQGCVVNSLPIVVIPDRGLNCYFPMPFKRHARITLENQHKNAISSFFYQVDYCLGEVPQNAGYFHAQWRRERLTQKGRDYVVLDNVQGRGQYVGTYLALSTLERYWWGEGEMKFYLDGDDEYPTIAGRARRITSAARGASPPTKPARRSSRTTARRFWGIRSMRTATRRCTTVTTTMTSRPCVGSTGGTFPIPSISSGTSA